MNDTDLLDPALYERVRLPLLQAETMPPWCYTSQQFYEHEIDRIFRHTWNFVAREDEIGGPGDYMAVELFGEPVALVRGGDGAVRAFANTCRHRGARLLCGKGNRKTISCPYHSWTYNLTGELRGAPGMDETENFKREEFGLIPLRLESWQGFLFLNFDRDAPTLLEHLGNFPEVFGSYNFADMVCVGRKGYDLRCNWKIYVENAMEDYHTSTVHRKSIGTQKTTREDSRSQWDAIHMPGDSTIAILPQDETTFPRIPTLQGKAAEGSYFAVIYPNMFLATTVDCMWWLHCLPLAADRTLVTHGACFPKSTVARPDFEEVVKRYWKRWEKSLPEDNLISEEQQAGLQSHFSRAGRFSVREPIVHAIDNWVLDRVLTNGHAHARA
jgi:choline monooxygenase